MWNRVKIKRGGATREARQTPAVRRNMSGGAQLIVPSSDVPEAGDRVDVFTDGNGRLAFRFGKAGEYKAHKTGQSHLKFVTIPNEYADRLPYGTRDVVLENDGGMLVLDLARI